MPDKSISSETNVLVAPIDLAKLYAPFFHQDGTPSDARANMAEVMKSPSQVTIAKAWAGSGVGETPFVVNVTDPGGSANAASKLLDLQAGGSSRVSVLKGGLIGSHGSNQVLPPADSVPRFGNWYGSGALFHGSGLLATFNASGLNLSDTVTLSWNSNLVLTNDAADILAQRRSTNPQRFRLYNTDNGANDEFLELGFDGGNVARIYSNKTGTGTARAISIGVGTTERLGVSVAGDLLFGTHTALAAEVVTGYITIKDSAGNTRKLAVVS